MKHIPLPFTFEESKRESGITALAGLPLYMDLAAVSGVLESIHHCIHVRTDSPGWTVCIAIERLHRFLAQAIAHGADAIRQGISPLKLLVCNDSEGVCTVKDGTDLIGAPQHDGEEMSPIGTRAAHALREILFSR